MNMNICSDVTIHVFCCCSCAAMVANVCVCVCVTAFASCAYMCRVCVCDGDMVARPSYMKHVKYRVLDVCTVMPMPCGVTTRCNTTHTPHTHTSHVQLPCDAFGKFILTIVTSLFAFQLKILLRCRRTPEQLHRLQTNNSSNTLCINMLSRSMFKTCFFAVCVTFFGDASLQPFLFRSHLCSLPSITPSCRPCICSVRERREGGLTTFCQASCKCEV